MVSPALKAQQLEQVGRQVVELGATLFPTQEALDALTQPGIDRLPRQRIDAAWGSVQIPGRAAAR